MKKLLYFAAMLLCFAACEDKNEQETPAKPEMTELEQTAYQMQVILNSYGNYDPNIASALLYNKHFMLWSYLEYNESWNEIISPYYAFGVMNSEGLPTDSYLFKSDNTVTYQTEGINDKGVPENIELNGSWTFDENTKKLTLIDRQGLLTAISEELFVWDIEKKNTSQKSRYFRLVYIVQ